MKYALIVVVLVLIVLVSGVWLYNNKSSITQSLPSPSPTPTMVSVPSSPPPPLQLSTKYISPVNWPPVVKIDNQQFNCISAGSEIESVGLTKKMTINNHVYCVTKETEGAAGSIYTQYAYARAKSNQTEIFTFSLRFVQCGNYPDPERIACERERQDFNIDSFIDQYIQSGSYK